MSSPTTTAKPSAKRWVPPPPVESPSDQFFRKIKSSPLVPIGCLATALVLSYGLFSFKRGNSQMSQKMMRLRVLVQGGTVMALVGAIAMGSSSSSKK